MNQSPSLLLIGGLVVAAHLILLAASTLWTGAPPPPVPVRLIVKTVQLNPQVTQLIAAMPEPAKPVVAPEPELIPQPDPEPVPVLPAPDPEPEPEKPQPTPQPLPEPKPKPLATKKPEKKEGKPAPAKPKPKPVAQKTPEKKKPPKQEIAKAPPKKETPPPKKTPPKPSAEEIARKEAEKAERAKKAAEEVAAREAEAKARAEKIAKQNALLDKAKQSIAKVKTGYEGKEVAAVDLSGLKTIEALHIDALPTTGSVSDFSQREVGYIDELVSRLKLSLRLPEYGDVKIKLTLERSGKVAKLEIVKQSSEANKKYVEKKVPALTFPPFGNNFGAEGTYTFLITLSNEL
jgi:colicin import membrane protein